MHGTDTFRLAEHVSRKASGRKPTRKATATRQKILDAAAEIFSKRGYSLTRLSDIAESAGVHLTALYYYYDSKEALVADIISFVPTRTLFALQRALNALPRSVRHQQRIETAFDVYLDSILKDDDYVRADHRIAAQISPQVRKRAVAISRLVVYGRVRPCAPARPATFSFPTEFAAHLAIATLRAWQISEPRFLRQFEIPTSLDRFLQCGTHE